jgi:hypothetical protein
MTKEEQDERPNCEKLLKEKHLWALSENEFDIENELKIVLGSKIENQNIFIYSILETKLIEIKNNFIKTFCSKGVKEELFSSETDENNESEFYETSESENDEYSDSEINASNEKIESIFINLMNEFKHRPTFIRKALFSLINYILNTREPRNTLIQEIIVLMENYSKFIDIQILAIGCLFLLTRIELSEKIHSDTLEKLIDFILSGMELNPNDEVLQTSALSILNNDYMLENCKFDKLKCIQLVMDALVTLNDIIDIDMAVDICSVLSSNLSVIEKSKFFTKPVYMETLSKIVESRVMYPVNNDIILEYTLSTLTNLTCKTKKISEFFVKNGGLELSLFVLNVSFEIFFENFHIIEKKIIYC